MKERDREGGRENARIKIVEISRAIKIKRQCEEGR